MLDFIFWLSIFMIFYAYFGYPLCLMGIFAWRKLNRNKQQDNLIKRSETIDPENQGGDLPEVSFIITAYNEESRISEKIENSIEQDYPKDKLELIVASDCSNDNTDEIVKSYAERSVKLVRAAERKGKENAQKAAVDASEGEILVFSDVATILKPNAIYNIVQNFADPTVGCVSSEDKFIDKDGNISGEGAYVRYEMFLRGLETRVNTLVGLSGSFFAAKRTVCDNWAVDLQSDFNTLLNSMKQGLRGVSDPKCIGYYYNIADEKKEFQRKVRTVLRGITVLMRNLSLFDLRKHGLFSWQLFSHKLCRWLVPFFMILALLTNILVTVLQGRMVFILCLQILFYAAAYYYHYTQIKKRETPSPKTPLSSGIHRMLLAPSRLIYFFISVNTSILVAWMNFIKGKRSTFWEPSKR